MERVLKLGIRVLVALLVCMQALALDACAFRGRESVTYYQGNFPTYKQGPDGRYYPADRDGSFMPLDYGYRPDLKGYSVIVPQGQQQAQQGQVPPGGQQPIQVRPGQLVPAGQPYVVVPQQGAPGAAVPPRVDPSSAYSQQQAAGAAAGGVAYGAAGAAYAPPPMYGQPPYAINPYAPAQGTPPAYAAPAARRPVLPTGYSGDNDEGYSIAVTPEQVDNEAKERAAAAPILPKAQQPAQAATGKPSRLPDLNKIYSNTVEDADTAYQIPSGYSGTNVDDYNTYYNY